MMIKRTEIRRGRFSLGSQCLGTGTAHTQVTRDTRTETGWVCKVHRMAVQSRLIDMQAATRRLTKLHTDRKTRNKKPSSPWSSAISSFRCSDLPRHVATLLYLPHSSAPIRVSQSRLRISTSVDTALVPEGRSKGLAQIPCTCTPSFPSLYAHTHTHTLLSAFGALPLAIGAHPLSRACSPLGQRAQVLCLCIQAFAIVYYLYYIPGYWHIYEQSRRKSFFVCPC